ncbi:MAG: IclR family transcriptional regulator [Desulfobacteraceae bacterium]|nr:IclR family transcriptional regulator [Desulfobacteraceae bacterium]
MPSKQDQYFSKTLEKGLSILNLFGRENPSRSLTEIATLTGINKTSTYRLVNTLIQLGYLRKSLNDKSLRLGPKAFSMGHECFHGFDVFQGIKPIIDKTFFEHHISIDSALIDGYKLISLYRREMPNLVSFHLPLIMDELYARAMGKIVLANLDPAALDSYFATLAPVKMTPHTLVDIEDIKADITATKTRGYSINHMEYITGVISIGAPMMNLTTKSVVGSVSLDFPSKDYPLEAIEQQYIGVLLTLAGEASDLITNAGIRR